MEVATGWRTVGGLMDVNRDRRKKYRTEREAVMMERKVWEG